MSGLIESASAILRASQDRLESTSRNVANVTTPAYKRQIGFSTLVAARRATVEAPVATQFRPDLSQGKLSATGNPLDIAISGDGFFRMRDGETTVYSRQGQFSRSSDGTLVTPQGYVLQQADGSDVMVDDSAITVQADGTILDGGRPIAKLGVYTPDSAAAVRALDGSAFEIDSGHVSEAANPSLRQGMVEASNVSIGDEMTTMMAALRQAESGSRLVQTYDDLLGRAISSFGQGGQ